MHLLSDLMKRKNVALKSWKQERVAEIEKSWKSYTCFSADYLKKMTKNKNKNKKKEALHLDCL